MYAQILCNRINFWQGGGQAILELADIPLVDTHCVLGKPFATSNSLNRSSKGFSEFHLLTRKGNDKALLRKKELYAIAICATFSCSEEEP